jgi:hypothetical protein
VRKVVLAAMMGGDCRRSEGLLLMSDVSLDVVDAGELVGMLDFISKWFAGDREVLDRSLRRFVGVEGYDIESLRGDLERFIFLLGGDGEALFGPGSR